MRLVSADWAINGQKRPPQLPYGPSTACTGLPGLLVRGLHGYRGLTFEEGKWEKSFLKSKENVPKDIKVFSWLICTQIFIFNHWIPLNRADEDLWRTNPSKGERHTIRRTLQLIDWISLGFNAASMLYPDIRLLSILYVDYLSTILFLLESTRNSETPSPWTWHTLNTSGYDSLELCYWLTKISECTKGKCNPERLIFL